MKKLISLILFALSMLMVPSSQASFIGESLDMDLPGEMANAGKEGKGLVVMFHYSGCPFCDKMRQRVFPDPAVVAYYSQHFVLLETNIRGDLEMVAPNGEGMSEKQWAHKMRIRATPVFLFFDAEGKERLKLTGYQAPNVFIQAGRYVQEKGWEKGSFVRWLRQSGS
ncbi:thioredoxin family protein [Magnetococcus marinus]|uniref:thioredoxin family protein n=1 Tax=Magnetococcus marinus TaxID=1124597 RepID=UPI00059FD099|nr:thioredoxin family protein [Magnetococcus marinus]